MRRLAQHQLLAAAVPGYMQEEYAILAAWYYKAGELLLEEALAISGLDQPTLEWYVRGKRRRATWAELGRKFKEIRDNKRYKDRQNLKSYVLNHTSYTYEYVIKLIKIYEKFCNTPFESLSFNKALHLSQRLNQTQLDDIVMHGAVHLKGRLYSADDIQRMCKRDFYRVATVKLERPSGSANFQISL